MSRLATFALIASIALATEQAQAAVSSAFNLDCVAKSGSTFRLRINLAERKWCADECRSVLAIDSIGDQQIRMSFKTNGKDDYWNILLDRYTSNFYLKHEGYSQTDNDVGHCSLRPFSGFPSKEF